MYHRFKPAITTAPNSPTIGAEAGVDAMYFVGIMLMIEGVPGIIVIVIEPMPKRNAAMKRCQGTFSSRNSGRAIGMTAKITTNRLTPPRVSAIVMADTASKTLYWLLSPMSRRTLRAIAAAAAESSMSLPKTDAVRNIR